MVDGKYTTLEAAGRVGISLPTLQRWIAAGKIKAPKPTLIGAVGYRLWSAAAIDRLKTVKQAVYRKRGGLNKKKV
jgi:excisionase family DNA binding protein